MMPSSFRHAPLKRTALTQHPEFPVALEELNMPTPECQWQFSTGLVRGWSHPVLTMFPDPTYRYTKPDQHMGKCPLCTFSSAWHPHIPQQQKAAPPQSLQSVGDYRLDGS